MWENVKIWFYKTRLGKIMIRWVIKEIKWLEWYRFIECSGLVTALPIIKVRE